MRPSHSFAVALASLSAFFPVATSSSSSGSLDGAAVSVPTSSPAATTSSGSTFEWTSCGSANVGGKLEPSVSFECTTLNTTVCYSALDGGCSLGNSMQHSFQIKRPQTQTAGPTVWVVHDSILSKQSPEQVAVRLFKQADARVYVVQSRLFDQIPNANDSSLTPCGVLAANYTSSINIDTSVMTAMARCKNWINTKFGTNGIRAYSVDSAAQDLALAIATVTNSTNAPFIYASGRGVQVVSRLLATTSLTIAGVIYDSPLLTPQAEEPVGAAMSRLVDSCGDDPLCRDKFKGISTSFKDMLKKTYETVDRSSKSLSVCYQSLYNATFDATRDLKPSHGVRRFFMAMRRTSPSGSRAIPPLLYRFKRCDKFDVKFFQRFFGKTTSQSLTDALKPSPMAAFVDFVTSFSESRPTPQPRNQLVSAFEASLISDGLLVARQPSYCAFTGSSDSSCTELYKDGAASNKTSPLTYQPTKAAASKTDVLVLASRISAFGSATAATQLYDTLAANKTSDQTVIMVQSDELLTTEIDDSAGSSLFGLVDSFLTKRAKALNGKWHSADLDGFSLTTSPSTTSGTVSSLDTRASIVSFTMSRDDSKAWFQQYDPYEGYKIISIRGGEQDDFELMLSDNPIPWEAIIVATVGAMGMLYVLYWRCKFMFEGCRPSAPPMYASEPVALPNQWNQTLFQQPPPPPHQYQAQLPQWQGQFYASGTQQQAQYLSQRLWHGRQQLQPTAPPMGPTQARPEQIGGNEGALVVQVHRL